MKDSTKNILKVVAVALAFVLIISSIFIIRSCSAPPDYEEVRERVEELIEASFDVNDIVWGEGLPTYPRIVDPKSSLTLYETGETYVDSNGKEQPLNYYYYHVPDSEFRVVAFRREKDFKADYRYAFISYGEAKADFVAELFPFFPSEEGEAAPEDLYTEVFADAETNNYAYLIPYSEFKVDFYYMPTDPSDYDYVKPDSDYASIDAIKAYIRTVYASDYADSLDSVLFDGVMEGDFIQKARYSLYQSSRGPMLVSLNTYKPLFSERRVYLYDTAKIDRSNSNDSSILVEFSTYLPSNPDKIEVAKVNFLLVDGVWYLSSPTY